MSYAVCIPSRGRPSALIGLFRKCTTLNSSTTFVGIEPREERAYASWFKEFPKPQVIWIHDNDEGFISSAREPVRQAAVEVGFDRYVLADDDNRFTSTSLATLVRAHELSEDRWGPSFVSAYYSIQGLYKMEEIKYLTTVLDGHTLFPAASFSFWVLPSVFYRAYAYPRRMLLDDVHIAFAAARQGLGRFYVCKEAAFTFERWQAGGAGSVAERVAKFGQSMIQLATDFPEFMTPQIISLRIPYNDVFTLALQLEKERQRGQSRTR